MIKEEKYIIRIGDQNRKVEGLRRVADYLLELAQIGIINIKVDKG